MPTNCCASCKFWKKIKDNDCQKDMGDCEMLSGKRNGPNLEDNIWPSVEKTGIESTPICYHDGSGFEYETKNWFCCFHYNAR